MITASSLNDGYHHLNNPTTQQQRVIVQPDSLLMNNSYSTRTSNVGDTVPGRSLSIIPKHSRD